MRNLRTRALLAALLCVSATVSRAADDWCPSGEFETDLAKITRSFIKPDTHRLEQTTLSQFGEAPAEIARIRSGVIWDFFGTGDFGPRVAHWEAYDADRHVFVLVDGGGRLLVDTDRAGCNGYQFKLRAGDLTYCMTIVAGTPDQARQFACRVNRLAADAARAAVEAARQAEESKRKHDQEWAKIKAAAVLEEANKPGLVPQVLVLGDPKRAGMLHQTHPNRGPHISGATRATVRVTLQPSGGTPTR
jgi:hypothetical protein